VSARLLPAKKSKAKAVPKAKAAKATPLPLGGDDTDLSDIEAELEAEPVATVAGEKVKPLRMKISKAKERALMKEFG
jgi:RNA polymerase primary sigma factor